MDNTNENYKLEYNYQILDELSSGITSYAPKIQKEFQYQEPIFIPYQSEMPSPLVLYNNVRMDEYGNVGTN